MLSTLVLALIFAQEGAPAELSKWRLQTFLPAGTWLYKQAVAGDLCERVKVAAQGQINITAYPGGTLVPPSEILKSVAEGIVEIGHTVTGYHVGFMPVCAVGDGLPMSWRGANDLLECFWKRGFGDLLREQYAKHGVHLLTVYCSEPYTVISKKPLHTKADWKGTKIRSWGLMNKFIAKLGASPVDLPLVEVYTALAMGTLDGAYGGVTPHHDFKHYEVCKYGLWPPLLGSGLHDVYINLKTWNSLSAELKGKITSAAHDWCYHTTDLSENRWKKDKGVLTDKGLKWQDVEDRDWLMKEAMPVWAEVGAKDPVSAKAVKLMTDYLKEGGGIK
jgi:TRAP-type C4-dicarboxylate transport system substrate-binding protein